MAKFQYKEICYPSQNEALQAFISSDEVAHEYVAGSGHYLYSKINGSVDSSGLITFAIRFSNNTTNTGLTYQLASCDSLSQNAIFDKIPVQDVMVAAALVITFVLGIGQGWKS